MKQITRPCIRGNEEARREPVDMRMLLNYNILNLLNRTGRDGPLDMPVLYCDTNVYPDYLALYNQPGYYTRGERTCVCFYQYDSEFDGKDGLFWAIYFNDNERLAYFKERFKGVRFFIGPDHSVFGDIHKIENYYRILRARIICLWFSIELGAIVIPNVSYTQENDFPIYFSGLTQCSVVAFSTKCHVRYPKERKLLIAAVKYAVDHLPLKTIVVYSVCGMDETTLKLFQYASDRGIQIIIPNNSLRESNMRRAENGKRK